MPGGGVGEGTPVDAEAVRANATGTATLFQAGLGDSGSLPERLCSFLKQGGKGAALH